jgi:UDP-3-O-[3-hydroxymyristoyl] glucosamine N-acyltransferase
MNNVPAGEVWGGYPAEPMALTMRSLALLRKLRTERMKRGDGNG